MRKNDKKAFTLIELIAVLVILAVIAIIVTPLVLNIIKSAKDSANRRSVDGYGKAAELAVATYRMEKGYYPKTFDELNIEYSGSNVKCNEQIINKNGRIYLSECYVDKIKVKSQEAKTDEDWYTYGKLIANYVIGDIVTYNDIKFYVISNSNTSINYVTLLKVEPLTVDEVNTYGSGHINEYANSQSTRGAAYDYSGYGGMVYYSSSNCGDGIYTGCTNDYNKSEIKYVVDAWANDKLDIKSLVTDKLGYKVRLITYEELTNNLEYAKIDSSGINVVASKSYADLMYGSYWYWTMTPYQDYDDSLWFVTSGHLASAVVYQQGATVRPVINLKKSVIE